MIYIQSATQAETLEDYYLKMDRLTRSIGLTRDSQRPLCLKILAEWKEYLKFGDLCDIDGLTSHTAEMISNPVYRNIISDRFGLEHIFIDEFQDFSTIEMLFLRQLVGEGRKPNQFFMVGDLNQKVFAKHHNSVHAGFNFQGRSRNISRNYRNTRQILEAAYQIPQNYPPNSDDDVEIVKPELSSYEAGRPIVIPCSNSNHLSLLCSLLIRRKKLRVAVLSEDNRILESIKSDAIKNGLECYELFRNEDLDFWRKQNSDSLSASVCVSRLEAVKGLEFDTVIIAGMSAGVIPSAGTPQEEKWREAAIVYAAMTRARDELIITFEDIPSEFLETMKDYVDYKDMREIENMLAQV